MHGKTRPSLRSSHQALIQLARLATDAIGHPASGLIDAEVCQLAAHTLVGDGLSIEAWNWVQRHAVLTPLTSNALAEESEFARRAAELRNQLHDPLIHFYEAYLQACDGTQRKRHGVFYTPREVARFVVRAVDQQLRTEFDVLGGLAEPAAAWLRVLDPALGSGVFLTEIIELVHQQNSAGGGDWQSFVEQHLLSRLGGIEIVPAAAYLALVRIAQTLAKTGYEFHEQTPPLWLTIGDALAHPIRPAWPVVIGNPPFSGVSQAKHLWLQNLLHGLGPDNVARADYFEVAGQPLGERKHWLQDDYVKFLRIAHEQIETVGYGIVAFVTNHGYLENITFAGMREKLEQTFPLVTAIDLHGNAKRRERTPADERDENVFGIEQGVAIGLFRRPPAPVNPRVERGDVWGTREHKLALLKDATVSQLAIPAISAGKHGRVWSAQDVADCPKYDAAWLLTDIFPLNTTAPVTARDDFVVADSEAELLERCQQLADPLLTDNELRQRYFHSTRSRLYPPGDTRGWKLPAARERMRQQADYSELVQPVQYRPLDWRAMLWSPWLIDWPRTHAMSHVMHPGNLTLIARRQSPPQADWNYVWITRGLTLDGVIRSDNCGSESLFPLWLTSGEPNLNPEFTQQLATLLNTSDLSPEDTIYYIYGLLQSPGFRDHYRLRLERAFPRIPLPSSFAVWQTLVSHGQQFVALHASEPANSARQWTIQGEPNVAKGYPKHSHSAVFINSACQLGNVSDMVWNYRIGSHQVARKFLKDRRGHLLSAKTLASYAHIVDVLDNTLALQTALDRTLSDLGGLPGIFTSSAPS